MARYLLSLPPETKKYVLFDEKGNEDLTKLPVYAHPVYYLTYHKVPNMEIIKGDTVLQGPAIFLMVNYNNDIEARIRKIFPTLEVKRIDINGPRTGGDFNIIVLP